MNGRELRAARKDKIARKFAAMAEPVAPPVEMDDAYFLRSDLAYASARDSGELERSRDHAALQAQQQRERTGI
jgi:hypothetical protein